MVIILRILLILSCTISTVQAELIASISKQSISDGDTISLRITATGSSSGKAPDFSPLTRDFIILSQQRNYEGSVINGKSSLTSTWQLSLLAKSLGQLTIPSIQIGSDRSRPLAITVNPAPKNQTVPPIDSVSFESSLSSNRVYLGGQSLLTIKISHRGNMLKASLDEPIANGANIIQTHEAIYRRVIDGIPVTIIERVYAVFVEAVGETTINAQTLTAELTLGGQRSIFGYNNTKTTRRNSLPQTITVLALPAFAKDKDTVSAADLTFEQQWSSPLNNLRVGDAITRTLRITANGATGAQIPPLFMDNISGIKIYTDQPELNDEKTQQGIIGSRTESTAYVLTKEGSFEVPALVLHWVNSATGKVQSVSVPSTQLRVAPALEAASTASTDATNTAPISAPPVIVTQTLAANSWFWVSILLGVLWLITLLLLWRLTPIKPQKLDDTPLANPSSKLFKQLILNAKINDAQPMLTLFNQWGRSLNKQLINNQQICDFLADEEISKSIQRAERSLYQAGDNAAWSGASLVSHLLQWQQQHAKAKPEQLRALYQ